MSTNKLDVNAVNARAREEQTPMTKIPSVEEYSKAYEERSFERMSELAMRLVERNETQRLALLTELREHVVNLKGVYSAHDVQEAIKAHLDELINPTK